MIKINNIAIIGTSHVSRNSVKEIEAFIEKNKPDIIAIELDAQRLQALIKKKKSKPSFSMIREFGFKGFVFLILGSLAQKIIGKRLQIMPGSDMYAAFKQAKKNSLKIALIDQDIRITLRRFSKNFKFRDFFSMIKDFLKGIFIPKKQLKNLGLDKLAIGQVPEDEVVEAIIKHMQKHYPGIYKSLIDERNKLMAINLLTLHHNFPEKSILAVVGKGHEKGIMEILSKNL